MTGELTLSEEQAAAIVDARKALMRSLDRRYPPRTAGILGAVALAQGFIDLVNRSAGRDELVSIVNTAIAGAGLQLTPTARH
jgi:hypothetical protein